MERGRAGKARWASSDLLPEIEAGEIWLLTLYAKNVAESISGRTLKKIKEEIDGQSKERHW
ncbi:hypothetical protein GCM10011488_45450 [Steroidobacter agaridevorans]|nr:hypothetical protein GCM10011488_45450 [Steroidobacter agaridevorans]